MRRQDRRRGFTPRRPGWIGSANCRRITLPAEYQDRQPVKDLVERLMGKNPEHRFNFIQANAANISDDEIDA